MAQYYETDQMGIVHHSNYIRWFEEARTDILRQCGLTYGEMERLGVLIPVLSVSCDYHKPVRYEDVVEISATVENFVKTHGVRFQTNYRVTCAATGELVTIGQTKHCVTDADLKLVRVERDYPAVYQAFKSLEELGERA